MCDVWVAICRGRGEIQHAGVKTCIHVLVIDTMDCHGLDVWGPAERESITKTLLLHGWQRHTDTCHPRIQRQLQRKTKCGAMTYLVFSNGHWSVRCGGLQRRKPHSTVEEWAIRHCMWFDGLVVSCHSADGIINDTCMGAIQPRHTRVTTCICLLVACVLC